MTLASLGLLVGPLSDVSSSSSVVSFFLVPQAGRWIGRAYHLVGVFFSSSSSSSFLS
jgi:hypothetical protein